MPAHPPSTSRADQVVQWAALAGVLALSFALFYHLCQLPSSDISIHAAWAAEGDFSQPVSFLRHGAHPLWHVLVAALLRLGLPLDCSATLITTLSKGAQLCLVRNILSSRLRMSANAVTLLSVLCVLVSSLCVPWYNPTVYYNVGTPNTWHSCTQLAGMVFMLMCVPLTARCYDRFDKQLPSREATAPWRDTALLGALLFLSLLAKPTFMQAFLPAACLFFLVQWIRHPRNSRYFLQVLLCVLPSILFMLAQYFYYFGALGGSQGSVTLEVSLEKAKTTLLCVLLMQAFPLYAFAVSRKAVRRDTLFWLTLGLNAVSVLEFLFLGESGRRAGDGNFGWGMMGAAMMSWVVGLSAYFQARSAKALSRFKALGGDLLLGWHLISGVYYIVYLFTSGAAL